MAFRKFSFLIFSCGKLLKHESSLKKKIITWNYFFIKQPTHFLLVSNFKPKRKCEHKDDKVFAINFNSFWLFIIFSFFLIMQYWWWRWVDGKKCHERKTFIIFALCATWLIHTSCTFYNWKKYCDERQCNTDDDDCKWLW